jgi:hypothetical protein
VAQVEERRSVAESPLLGKFTARLRTAAKRVTGLRIHIEYEADSFSAGHKELGLCGCQYKYIALSNDSFWRLFPHFTLRTC